MLQHKDADKIDAKLIEMLTLIGIEQKLPTLLGTTMKYLITNGYNVREQTFLQCVMVLERCKGYEEDANRFINLSYESKHI